MHFNYLVRLTNVYKYLPNIVSIYSKLKKKKSVGATPLNRLFNLLEMATRRDSVINIALRPLLMSTFLIRSGTSQSISYLIFLAYLDGPHSRPNHFQNFGSARNRTHDLGVSSQDMLTTLIRRQYIYIYI